MIEFTPLDVEFMAARQRHAARENARLDTEEAVLPPVDAAPTDVLAGVTYRPPLESVCAHGKTLGPCPHCNRIDVQEQRDSLAWTVVRDE